MDSITSFSEFITRSLVRISQFVSLSLNSGLVWVILWYSLQECVTNFALQIMKSLEVGYWVDEEPYELSDAFPAAQVKISDC